MATLEAQPETKPLRVWPVFLIVLLQVATLVLTVTDQIQNAVRFGFMMLGPLVCLVMFIVWWMLASRASWGEKFRSLFVAVLLVGAVALAVHSSMGVAVWIYGVPIVVFSMAMASVVGRQADARKRTRLMMVIMVIGLGWMPLMRLTGFDGAYFPEMTWRWIPTQDELLADRAGSTTAAPDASALAETRSEWPGFRGPDANSRVSGFNVSPDWVASKPVELWRNEIGPGWSSFSVSGSRLYTQEQRGEYEVTVCYNALHGDELWRYSVESRFDEVVSGAGPRATPTIVGDTLLSYGAKGILCCLDAVTGELRWQHDLLSEFDGQLPMWGYSGSPTVVGDLCVAFGGGSADNGLIAFDLNDGSVQWKFPAEGMNFSTPQLCTLGGVPQVLFETSAALVSIDPENGEELWRITPENWRGPAMVQAQQIDETSVIVPLGDGIGVARIAVSQEDGTWAATETWNSRDLKPSFNDFVYHEGYLYGFDQSIFTCIDAATGERQWKRGRYGFGQVLLVADSAHLIVQAESGKIVLLAADPEEHKEIAELSALSDKTWNHPILVKGRLYVRNGLEAACYMIPGKVE